MNLPCIDCITYPICKIYYLQEMEKSEGLQNQGYISCRNKCSLLDSYFTSHRLRNTWGIGYRSFISYIEEGKFPWYYHCPAKTV